MVPQMDLKTIFVTIQAPVVYTFNYCNPHYAGHLHMTPLDIAMAVYLEDGPTLAVDQALESI